MESNSEFRISVDLSEYFTDTRNQVRIFITNSMKKVEDLENKISSIFHILEDFHLTILHEYLPSCEDIRIIQNGELIRVNPGKYLSEKQIERHKKGRKRNANSLLEIQEDAVCLKQAKINGEEHSYVKKVKAKKRDKIDVWRREEECENGILNSEQTSSLVSEYYTEKNKSAVEKPDEETKDYTCKGNLASYTKNIPIPTITDKYLKQKKVNIVKINVIRNSSDEEKDTDLKNNTEKSTSMKFIQNKKNSLDCSQDYLDAISSECLNQLNNQSSIPNSLLTFVAKENCTKSQDGGSVVLNEDKLNGNSLVAQHNEEENKCDIVPDTVENNQITDDNDIVKEAEEVEKRKRSLIPFVPSFNTAPQIFEKFREKYCVIDKPPIVEQKQSLMIVDLSDIVETIQHQEDKTENTSIIYSEQENHNHYLEIENSLNTSVDTLNTAQSLTDLSNSICDISSIHYLSSSSTITKPFKETKKIAGIGSLLEQLRNDSSCPSSIDTSSTTHPDNITKRKRVRTRKRKKKSPMSDCNSTSVPYQPVKLLNTQARPLMHLKFDYEGDSSVQILDDTNNEETKIDEKRDNKDDGNVETNYQNFIKDKDIEKAPVMKDMLPKVGDIVSFKILRISNTYTPEISSYITGKVVQFQNKSVIFEIIAGLDQCLNPTGKLTVEEHELISNRQTFSWNDLIEPHLLFP